ncbi:5-deoxy-glucuronate isomerase [Hoeflea poritis]|uniref:5-deoxy-glucuronate isomerase n=1 Tax=Hoeflea poritis TaxID=2993659 RepID=A0ABT4VIQ8_9HYPH|nr:5-deoxy-glucuronate isomerase [Hoeflea poritis]MDA4844587.1 5-deoxy-glucuronate isomerase [Hoeflea poritis]
MSKLLVKPTDGQGRVTHITPQNAGWQYVGFDLHRLRPGDRVSEETGHREVCLVLVSGKARIAAGGEEFGLLGERMSPFDGVPSAVYVPGGSDWTVSAETEVELAVCSAPDPEGNLPARVIAPSDLSKETRGSGTNTRYVTNILPEDQPAQSLLVVEVITPGGHTSSYPPHKHDQDNLPHESLLEETYYHRLNPPQGFAFQRVYTDDRSLDESMAVEDGDVTLVPKGYHPCAACHGYDLYYLNVMAGPRRTWKFHNAAEHEWLLNAG